MSTPMASSSSSQSCNYDVFLSFRGEDTRKTFVDHLYSALVDRSISTYKDDETLPRGESIRPSLFKAIKGSQIAVIIFSKNYADSSWCLEELAYIMKCKDKRGLIVMPVFYDVAPSEVRKQKGDFGRGFSKQEVENTHKVESWRKALVHASEIAGWEPKNIANGHESKGVKEIVDIVSDKLFSLTSDLDEDLVGMSDRLQELEAHLEIGSPDVRMVGIWGVGGSGKTTLASSLYMKISCHFQSHCIVDNIRDESSKHGLKSLQEKVLSSILNTQVKSQSVEVGKNLIRSRLRRSNVLIILDDVDGIEQLDALAGSHNWFGSGSRILITTRDEHLLRTHKVDRVCPVRLLSDEEAVHLFNKHAFNKDNPVNNYEKLSLRVVSYAAGLPLALKVLGSFLYDKDKKEWMSSLGRLKDIPEMEIVEKLKISYDGLKTVEKELFLDIACFFRGKSANTNPYVDDYAMEIFEACGYYPDVGIKVLRQKSLITIVDGRFDMHDLVQEMGHYIVKDEHPYNPGKRRRLWNIEEIGNMCLGDASTENYKIEAIRYYPYDICHSSLFCKIVSNMKKLRLLYVTTLYKYENTKGPSFLSNELRCIDWDGYPASPFPDSFQPLKLVALNLHNSLQKELWKGYKVLPQLKLLKLVDMNNLVNTPDFDGLPCLQKLTLHNCKDLEEIHPSLGNHTSLEDVRVLRCEKLKIFPTIVKMGKLKTLLIKRCHKSLEFPEIKSNMESLVKLSLSCVGIDDLLSSIGERCANLISLDLNHCFYLQSIEVNFDGLKHLEEFTLIRLGNMKMPDVRHISLRHCYGSQISIWSRFVFSHLTHTLRKLNLCNCSLKDGEIPSDIGELYSLLKLDLGGNDFTQLHFSLYQLTQLKFLILSNCKRLEKLPDLPSGIICLEADDCDSLTTVGDIYTNCKWLLKVSVTGANINDGGRLLQSMLEGHAIEHHTMVLRLQGLEITKGFIPPLVRGSRYTLKLPENWCNDFSGFLICAVGARCFSQSVSMKQLMNRVMDSEDVVDWVESDYDNTTSVWYVSFASLRHTAWWSDTYKAILFSLEKRFGSLCSEFGVRLVYRNGGSGSTETSTTQEESDFSTYTPKLTVLHDSTNSLDVELHLERERIIYLDYV